MGKKATNTEDKVLMTFQIEEAVRNTANEKAGEADINLSNFLRHCVYEFIASEEINKTSKSIRKQITRTAISKS